MEYPQIRGTIEVRQVTLRPGEFLPVYVPNKQSIGLIQVEVVVRKDGRVGIFFDENIDVLGFDEQRDWISEGGE